MTKTAQILAKRIKELRAQRGLTQKELARILGVTLVHMGNVEIGKRTLSDKARERLAEFFDIPLASLYDEGNYFNAEVGIKADWSLTPQEKEHLLKELQKIKEGRTTSEFSPPFQPPVF